MEALKPQREEYLHSPIPSDQRKTLQEGNHPHSLGVDPERHPEISLLKMRLPMGASDSFDDHRQGLLAGFVLRRETSHSAIGRHHPAAQRLAVSALLSVLLADRSMSHLLDGLEQEMGLESDQQCYAP